MDEIDVKILRCLKNNARENASVISEKVSMSVSAVIERIRKLENSGMIKQHTTIIDQAKAGKDVTSFISISLEHPKYIECFTNLLKTTKRYWSAITSRGILTLCSRWLPTPPRHWSGCSTKSKV